MSRIRNGRRVRQGRSPISRSPSPSSPFALGAPSRSAPFPSPCRPSPSALWARFSGGSARSRLLPSIFSWGYAAFPCFRGSRRERRRSSGGYIFGFFFAVLAPALFKLIPAKGKWARFGIFYAADILGLAVCYFFGTVWFVMMNGFSVGKTIALCVTPFILPDLVKLFVAALLSSRLEKYIR